MNQKVHSYLHLEIWVKIKMNPGHLPLVFQFTKITITVENLPGGLQSYLSSQHTY